MYNQATLNQFAQQPLSRQEVAERKAQAIFAQQRSQPLLGKVKGLFNRQKGRMEQFANVLDRATRHQYLGETTVSLQQITGSVSGRNKDFDIDFRPRNGHTEHRWTSIAAARILGKGMPPVQLVQVGDAYFVEDGHHRVSVAQALGDDAIRATVTLCSD